MELLKDYDCSILYHIGKTNIVVDALNKKSMGSLMHIAPGKRQLAKDVQKLEGNGVSFGVGRFDGKESHQLFEVASWHLGNYRGTFLDWTHCNSYTGGIITSGIPNLGNLSPLDLIDNQFFGPLPVELSKIKGLKFLILAYNQFNGSIPSEYGDILTLQALHHSFNKLTFGARPPSLVKLTLLLWLMLANNSLTCGIPPELGNCNSLLWLNLANNQLSGPIPPQLARIGSNLMPTFLSNRAKDKVTAGSGEMLRYEKVDTS
ncbi:putative LRR receptor-like serine/threonine-protein kinase [Capsicum baccatum]|uniref:LRR receptor-like serine/threonine-protein kinase n=1 Tax=Capsicum baccatum TaxID=33114 RepID=A0A2G2VTH9_CAPBA|nr:putative LRR receptor-like serine/threonine-protein kinase [Capsicum baccatum]